MFVKQDGHLPAFDAGNPSLTTWRPRHAVIGFVILFFTLVGMNISAGDGSMWINPPWLLWLLGCVAGVLCICFGPGTVLQALKALTSPRTSTEQTAVWMMVYARAYQALWAAGLLGMLAILISILHNADDPARMTVVVKHALIGPFYAGILAEFAIVPLQHIVAVRHGVNLQTIALSIAPRRAMHSIFLAVVFAIAAVWGIAVLMTTG